MGSLVCLKVLWSLFQSLSESSSMRFHVYYYLAGIAGRTGQLDTVYKDIPATNKLFTKAPLTIEQRQRLYRLLHEVLLANSSADQAGKEEAQRCIVASLADPNTFLFDHLL